MIIYDNLMFLPDMEKVNAIAICLLAFILAMIILYIFIVVLAEFVYFLFCKLMKRQFDYQVMLQILTDIEFKER